MALCTNAAAVMGRPHHLAVRQARGYTHAQRMLRGIASSIVARAAHDNSRLSLANPVPATAEKAGAAAAPLSSRQSRRAISQALVGAVMMMPAAGAVMRPMMARADDDEDEREYDENGVMIGLGDAQLKLQAIPLEDGAYYQVPGQWKSIPGRSEQWSDALLGPQVQQVKMFSAESDLTDMTDLGRIERVSLSKLPVPKELTTADLIGLKKRVRDGRVFYDWDLALAPATCPREQQLVQGLCFPDQVVLISATVAKGKIMVLEVRCNQTQWEAASKNIKEVRESFGVAA